MTDQTLVLPYQRGSPLRIPRRDLALSAGDSVALTISVVESDNPDAAGIDLTGGLGGPALQLLIFADTGSSQWDYGALSLSGSLLWSGDATISADEAGTFELFIAAGTLLSLPHRCVWAMQLNFDAATQVQTLASGMMHIYGAGTAVASSSVGVLTDGGASITDDSDTLVEA